MTKGVKTCSLGLKLLRYNDPITFFRFIFRYNDPMTYLRFIFGYNDPMTYLRFIFRYNDPITFFGGRKIWPGLVGRPGPPMTKGVKTCSLGLKLLNFLSYFLLHKLELLLINIHQVSKFLVKKIKRDSI
jgi:hypothetical protein